VSDASFPSTPLVRAALETARQAEAEMAPLWRMSEAQRLAAFYRGDLNLRQCLAWARRFPKEPPLAPDGEYLFIAWKTPEWADAEDALSQHRAARRELS
jgi:soluble lytic murein transglycosylase-like protein